MGWFTKEKKIEPIQLPTAYTIVGSGELSEDHCDIYKTKVTIDPRFTSIGEWCFKDNCTLEEIVIPEGVSSIGDSAFWRCRALKSVHIPSSLNALGDFAFTECVSLEKIILPPNLKSIGSNCFYECKNIKTLFIPQSVNIIGEGAFKDCGVVYVHYSSLKAMPDKSSISVKKLIISVDDTTQFWQLVKELNDCVLKIEKPKKRIEWIQQIVIELKGLHINYENIYKDKNSIIKPFEEERLAIISKINDGASLEPHRVMNNILNAVKYSYYKSL